MLAASNVPVVIMGESGTGKELIAQLIQSESNRKNNVFVTLNCGALTETLIDSSLFGTIKGAFTGADNSQGYLEFANGGTLFLDEFNSMPPSMQVKLHPCRSNFFDSCKIELSVASAAPNSSLAMSESLWP